MNTIVLNSLQIEQKIQRIAYEIVENHFASEKLYLLGIHGNGYVLVEKIATILKDITDQEIITGEVTVNKANPFAEEIKTSFSMENLENETVILIDDVINSGRTMQYALAKLLEYPIYRIKTVALVDRKHRRFPIRCDYIGVTLSTTLQDRVEVELGSNASAYLV